MAKMNRRTTFALDEATVLRLRKLSALLHISQAEVVRRAVEKAEDDYTAAAGEKLAPLLRYHKQAKLKAEEADKYLEEVAENRSSWGRNH